MMSKYYNGWFFVLSERYRENIYFEYFIRLNFGQIEVDFDLLGANKRFKILNKKLNQISLLLEKSKLNDYVYFLEHPVKMLLPNFLGGLARGLGIAVGFSLLGAVIVYLLKELVKYNLPIISDFVNEIVDIVENNLQNSGR